MVENGLEKERDSQPARKTGCLQLVIISVFNRTWLFSHSHVNKWWRWSCAGFLDELRWQWVLLYKDAQWKHTPPMRERESEKMKRMKGQRSHIYAYLCTPHIWKHFGNASKATKHYRKWQKAEFLDIYEWSIYDSVVTEIIKWSSLILIAEIKPIILTHNPLNSYHMKTWLTED